MNQDVMALALARKALLPDLYSMPVEKTSRKVGYPDHVTKMVIDLRDNVPGISERLISATLGLPRTSVQDLLRSADEVDDDFEPAKTNEEMCADELAALREHHDKYLDDPRAATEYDGIPIKLTAPSFRDSPRRVDQSHANKRPITLPTFPFLPLPDRYAAA